MSFDRGLMRTEVQERHATGVAITHDRLSVLVGWWKGGGGGWGGGEGRGAEQRIQIQRMNISDFALSMLHATFW